jgi:hypothetical protein
LAKSPPNAIIGGLNDQGNNKNQIFTSLRLWEIRGDTMSDQQAPNPQDQKPATPSAGKQLAVMAIIVVGIFIVLGGGVMLSQMM